MRVSRDTRLVGIYAELKVGGQAISLADPSGGTFNAAGDFDRLLPAAEDGFPVLARIDPHGDVVIPDADLAALASEVARLLEWPDDAPARRGLALAGKGKPTAELWFVGD
jgi:hypothetical protein